MVAVAPQHGFRRTLLRDGSASLTRTLLICDAFRFFGALPEGIVGGNSNLEYYPLPCSPNDGFFRVWSRIWMGGRVVDRAGLENRYTGNGIEGSNPSPSADFSLSRSQDSPGTSTRPLRVFCEPPQLSPSRHRPGLRIWLRMPSSGSRFFARTNPSRENHCRSLARCARNGSSDLCLSDKCSPAAHRHARPPGTEPPGNDRAQP